MGSAGGRRGNASIRGYCRPLRGLGSTVLGSTVDLPKVSFKLVQCYRAKTIQKYGVTFLHH